jgi:hypothetical protein
MKLVARCVGTLFALGLSVDSPALAEDAVQPSSVAEMTAPVDATSQSAEVQDLSASLAEPMVWWVLECGCNNGAVIGTVPGFLCEPPNTPPHIVGTLVTSACCIRVCEEGYALNSTGQSAVIGPDTETSCTIAGQCAAFLF